MVLQCLQQMIQLCGHNMRSGWRTMFAVFSAASKALTGKRMNPSLVSRLTFLAKERVVVTATFDIVTRLNKERFADIVVNGSFADFTACITDFCKVNKFQKIRLLAINMLQGVIPTMLRTPEREYGLLPAPDHANGLQAVDDAMIKSWYPILFTFYDVIMNGENLEVRRLSVTTASGDVPQLTVRILTVHWIHSSTRSRSMGQLSLQVSGTQPRASIPDFRCPSIVTRFIKVSNPGGHERI